MKEGFLSGSEFPAVDEKFTAVLKFCALGQMECSHLAGPQQRAKYTLGVATSEPWPLTGQILREPLFYLIAINACVVIAPEGPGYTAGHVQVQPPTFTEPSDVKPPLPFASIVL